MALTLLSGILVLGGAFLFVRVQQRSARHRSRWRGLSPPITLCIAVLMLVVAVGRLAPTSEWVDVLILLLVLLPAVASVWFWLRHRPGNTPGAS
jgi:hypothetical protein